jgi:transcriptional regulator with XRE-family HTH domain
MEARIMEIAQRIRGLRDILEISVEDMAAKTDVTPEQYRELESGRHDFGFTFLFLCSKAFGVDIVELLTGEKPKLSFYTVVRKGDELPIKREESFIYRHMAYRMQNKLAEPFVVTAPYSAQAQNNPIEVSRHDGQEFDYVLSGSLKVRFEDHTEILNEGDAIFYDSGYDHGMIATGGQDCTFLAVVIPHNKEEK